MSVAASVALAVAERVERTGGARAGLVAWRTLAGTAEGEVRAKALLAGLRCALRVGDAAAIEELTRTWSSVDRGVWDEEIAASCIELHAAGHFPRATALAAAEARRHRTARSLYCWARCLDVAHDAGAVEAFREAIARADKEGAKEIELAARVRLAAIFARSWTTMTDAIVEAQRVPPDDVPPEARLTLAGVLLRSGSRFTRASAIGVLDGLVAGPDPALALRALGVVARWADDAGDALTPLETDRLRGLFGRERAAKLAPRGKEIARALDAIAAAKDAPARERALADAARLATEPRRWTELLEVAGALRESHPAQAARALRELADAETRGERLPAVVLGLAQQALAFEPVDDELRRAALAIVGLRLRHARVGAPPGGWLRLADTLATLGQIELAEMARRAGVVAREPGAAESLGTWMAREGWELAHAGQRAAAIAKLTEARSILQGTSTS